MKEPLTDFQREYLEQMRAEELEKLAVKEDIIRKFINYCSKKGISLTNENFNYCQTIGITATYPNLLSQLEEYIVKDKEGLYKVSELKQVFKTEPFCAGMLYAENYIALAHPFFRRNLYNKNNWAPRFIEYFWGLKLNSIESYIALDNDRVRINVDKSSYMELDTWFGAEFNQSVKNVPDGIVKLRPPIDIEDMYIGTFFDDAYAFDVKWQSKEGIKTFQAEELKGESTIIEMDDKTYHPVRYIHAEFDLSTNSFRHFDGAIHLYTPEEYFQRRDNDMNYNQKQNAHIKTKSLKLFKLNGQVSVDTFVSLSCQFCPRNPLLFEYFQGRYPSYLIEKLKLIRDLQSKK